MKALVTGAAGFIGKNLTTSLARTSGIALFRVDRDDDQELDRAAQNGVDVVFHLAGVNRPEITGGALDDNRLCTERLVRALQAARATPMVIMSSSTQATKDNPYGRSKLAAEKVLIDWSHATGAPLHIYRLPNVFGKWAAPNYNSGVATFCHNAARGLELNIHDASAPLSLVYVDSVVNEFIAVARGKDIARPYAGVPEVLDTTVGEVADLVRSFPSIRVSGRLPDLSKPLTRYLYATYLSHLPLDRISYAPSLKSDARGTLFEFLKAPSAGQCFLSTTKPGITRGNHYHHTKVEKFLVIKGSAVISLRSILDTSVVRLEVSGDSPSVVDIPPGYTHSITNIGSDELITLFWASEIFDPENPDTYAEMIDAP